MTTGTSDRSLLVLRRATPLPGFFTDNDVDAVYDVDAQLWLWRHTGAPVVETPREQNFCGTLITATSEGVDQSEGARAFGQTICTTSQEGMDQGETVSSRDRGTTILTRTSEGVDQHEATSFQPFGLAD